MVSNRSTKIDEIISTRSPLAERIDVVIENLKKLKNLLINLDSCRQKLINLNDSETPQTLDEVNLGSQSIFIKKIDEEINSLNKLNTRFSRNTLNIAVIGNAGKGKSTLLEKLAGLPEGVIPRSSKGHCTSVAFTIVNGSGDSTIFFHTEQSFLTEVIHPYYRELSLGKEPETLVDFQNSLAPFSSDSPTKNGKYNYLKSYHKYLDSYRNLLGSDPLKISNNEILTIREYVAHTDIKGKEVYKSMAVRKATIVYEFPDQDVGKIALVDTPGLDDTGVGHIEKLTEILEHDVDVTLLIWLPEVQRGNFRKEDYELYEVAQKALGKKLPLKRWSFFILNQLDPGKGDNRENCEYIASHLSETPIEVVGKPIIINCLDPQLTKTEVLDRVLEYLCKEINNLDKDYSRFCQSEIDKIQQDIEAELTKLSRIFFKDNNISNKEFRRLFKEIWEQLIPKLENLVKDFRIKSENTQENVFKSQVEQAIQDCLRDKGIPDEEKIDLIRITKGNGQYKPTFYICLDKVRTNLSKKFAAIDVGLSKLVEDTKNEVAEVLINSASLGGLTELRGSKFINFMAENIPEEYKNLKEGFEILSGFELSYRGLFQPRIRKHLGPITPDQTDVQLPSNSNAAEIIHRLERLHERVMYDCQKAMQGMVEEPKLAAFAIVEEFYEQVFAAENVQDEWQDFLEENKEQIWLSRFNKDNKITALQEEWLQLIREAKLANQISSLSFLD